MALSSTDTPPVFECGAIDEAWIDDLNNTLSDHFFCLIDLQTQIAGLIQDLPDIICNAVSPRHFSQSIQGSGNLSLSLPAGGSWDYIVTYDGGDGAGTPFQTWIYDIDDDDNGQGGSTAGNAAGGTTFSTNQPGQNRGVLSIFAYRVDC